jgi:hypothetical protein
MAENTQSLQLTVDSLDGIGKEYQELYAKQDDGSFKFQTPAALLRAKGHEKEARQEKAKELEALTERLTSMEADRKAEKEAIATEKQRLEMEAAKKSGDSEAIEKSYLEKLAKMEADHQASIAANHGIISNLTVSQDAQKLATRLAGDDAALILPHIKSRLKSEITDGHAKTRVLDASGNPSAFTLDELHDEFHNNKDFASIIVGSKGSGGGATGSNSKNGGAAQKTLTRSAYEDMPLGDRPNLRKEGITLTD